MADCCALTIVPRYPFPAGAGAGGVALTVFTVVVVVGVFSSLPQPARTSPATKKTRPRADFMFKPYAVPRRKSTWFSEMQLNYFPFCAFTAGRNSPGG